jgi:hypothetical protein
VHLPIFRRTLENTTLLKLGVSALRQGERKDTSSSNFLCIAISTILALQSQVCSSLRALESKVKVKLTPCLSD